jgi:multidrug efflux system outer membrane protein
MSKSIMTMLALTTTLLVAGCINLEPDVPHAAPSIAAQWPLPQLTAKPVEPDARSDRAAADIGWRDFFVDPKIEALIGMALENNRDLRVAVLNIEKARAQYRIQRAEQLPAVDLSAGSVSTAGYNPSVVSGYVADINIGFELDLFGRIRNLSDSALQEYFATEEARRAAQLSLVAEVAQAYLTLSADQEMRRIAQDTLKSQTASYQLTVQRFDLGAVSALDVSQARTLVESARVDSARYAGQIARDSNALTLLVGTVIDASLLPDTFAPKLSGLQPLPTGLPSEVLLRRPEVLQSERQLRAANANIGAARAAFFPSISLTAGAGTTSTQLSGLFKGGSVGWAFLPTISVPIFQGGRLSAFLDMATVDRDIALAQYEKAIQSGFRDVADALELSQTLAEQLIAQQALLDAAYSAHQLSEARYKSGRDSYLYLLDAQRTLYSAQQAMVTTELATQFNRVVLYKVLGGGWHETTQ